MDRRTVLRGGFLIMIVGTSFMGFLHSAKVRARGGRRSCACTARA
jgi:hypothetical protein